MIMDNIVVTTPRAHICLPQVTLAAVSSLAIGPTVRALRASMQHIEFGAIKLFTDVHCEDSVGPDIERVPIAAIGSRQEYSRFMLRELADYIETDFVLCVQWDGYILNPASWDDTFLSCDYIGAPWPQFDDQHIVGNGGFSLRSLRLLKACKDPRVPDTVAEDVAIGRAARAMLEKEYAIVFANDDQARQFSYERTPPSGHEFGFHGIFNMHRHMAPEVFRALYAELEDSMHSRFETRELLRKAIRRGDFRLAMMAWQKLSIARK